MAGDHAIQLHIHARTQRVTAVTLHPHTKAITILNLVASKTRCTLRDMYH